MTLVSKWYLSDLKVLANTDCIFCAKDNDDLDNGNINLNVNEDIAKLQLDGYNDVSSDADLKEWFSGIKCDPLRQAHRVIYLLCSLDQCKKSFYEFVQSDNE
jgi:hypothetical protein